MNTRQRMMRSRFSLFCPLPSALCPLFALCLLLLVGCGNAVTSGRNTALDSVDLVEMTDQMAASIAGDPDVQAAAKEKGSLRIVVQPVVNQMTGEVLPRGQAETFTGRVRMLLAKQNDPRYLWIMNRDYFRYLRDKEIETDLGPNPDTTQPEYALTATFSSLTKEDSSRRSSYYLCTYELSRLTDRTVLWSDQYEVKKIAVKGYLD